MNLQNIFKPLLSGFQTKNLAAETKTTKPPLDWELRPASQYVLDIQKWRRALSLTQSENPIFYPLYDVYEKTLLDPFLSSQIENRFSQTLSAKAGLIKAKGETNDEASTSLASHPIDAILKLAMLETVTWGNTLIQLAFERGTLTASLVPRSNIDPINGIFYRNANDQKGIKYREMPEYGTWLLEFRNTNNPLGLLNKVVPQVVMKRYAQSCWSEHCEKFAVPPRVMKTQTTDAKMLARAKKMMEDFGRAAYFIIDQQEHFEFANQIQTKGEIYQYLIEVCKAEISMLLSGAIVGQDTENGSNAKETASQDLLWYRVQADMELVEQNYNTIALPALIKHGVVPSGHSYKFDPAEDIEQLFKFTSQAMNSFEVDMDWYTEKFGVKIVGAKQQQNQLSARSFFLNAPTKNGATTDCCGTPHTLIKLSSELNQEDLIQRFYDDKGERKFDADLFNHTTQNLTEGFARGWKKSKKAKLAIGIEYGKDDPAALTAYEMNLFRFGGIKTLAESQLLNKAFRDSKSFDDFRIRASLITNIHNVEWLRTEYNTAVSVGETSATYSRLISQTELFPYWEYRTVDDSKVRPEHALLNGLILPATHEIWQKIYPPNGWNCRCYIVPRMKSELGKQNVDENIKRFEEFIGGEEFQKATKGGWGINRADAEQVFTANQQYVTNITEANKLLSELTPDNYKIKAPTNIPKAEILQPEAFKQKGFDFTDYQNRSISIAPETVDTITDNELLAELQNVLNKPDEVWFQAEQKGKSFNQYLYIKTYQGQKIAVRAEYKKGKGLIIQNIFKVLSEAIRWGLLIK